MALHERRLLRVAGGFPSLGSRTASEPKRLFRKPEFRQRDAAMATATPPDNPEAFKPYIPASAAPREFTARAVIVGALLGVVFGASSLYLVLKVGLTVSSSIPVTTGFDTKLGKWAGTMNPFYGGAHADWLALLSYLLLCGLLYLVGRGVLMKGKPQR
jgi:hypothetical protein